MSLNNVNQIVDYLSTNLDKRILKAFIKVESGGKGFDATTGKIIIQFEPAWFRKNAPYAPTGKWSLNKVERQSDEWEAFNNAFAISPTAAMKSTSIGLPQIMGFHYRRLGYNTVGAMWDDFKVSEQNQIAALERFIESDPALIKAFDEKDWHKMAVIYNGSGYIEQAKRLGITPYNIQLQKAYESLQ